MNMAEGWKAAEPRLKAQYRALSKEELVANLLHWRKRFVDDLASVNADARVVVLRRRIDQLEAQATG